MIDPTRHETIVRVLLVLFVCVLCAAVLVLRPAHGQDAPSPELRLARVCYLEASASLQDCAAFAGVGHRRASRTKRHWLDELERYSAIRSGTERANAISAWPDADPPDADASDARAWATLRRYARQIVAGNYRDPCVASKPDHWGGLALPRDSENARRAVAAGRWTVAVCKPETANAFFREVR